MNREHAWKRRDFLKLSATLAAGMPLATALNPALADELPKLSEDDPTAQMLGYRHDASTVDTKKFPRRASESGARQFCHNCNLISGRKDQTWRPCAIFPGKLVSNKGWCNAWVRQG